MGRITAAELMAKLEKDEAYQARERAKAEHMANMEKIYDLDEKSLIEELTQAGFPVSSVWDFVNSNNYYLKAEPILVKHLKVPHHPRILEGIARSLAVKEFSGNDELWNLLVDLHEKTPSDSEIDIPEERGAQSGIAAALACLATRERLDTLKYLLDKYPNGDGVLFFQRRLNQFRSRKK